MVICMKTTVELPDGLLIEAKKRAAERRTTLRALLEEGLIYVLGRSAPPEEVKIDWVAKAGPGIDEAAVADRDSMYAYFEEESDRQ